MQLERKTADIIGSAFSVRVRAMRGIVEVYGNTKLGVPPYSFVEIIERTKALHLVPRGSETPMAAVFDT